MFLQTMGSLYVFGDKLDLACVLQVDVHFGLDNVNSQMTINLITSIVNTAGNNYLIVRYYI